MMEKSNILVVFGLFMISSITTASYAGPFLLWGTEHLNSMKTPTLQAIDDKSLRDIYAGASSIVVFIRNATTKLNYENFPRLAEVVGTTEWLYLPQEALSSDPLEYNVNAEVFVLTGPVEQQDVEIAALYRDAQVNYGQKNILGILATRYDHHVMYKRQAINEYTTTTEIPTTPSGDEPVVENLVYAAKGKGLLVTAEVPVLKIRGNKSSEDVVYELTKHAIVSADERDNDRGKNFRLIIKFIINEKPVNIKFVFQIYPSTWILNQVEYEKETLDIVGDVPTAPLGFSFACDGTFVFRKEAISLTLKNIQVQPLLQGVTKFSKAYDCVGILTAGIASGIFVTFILGLALSIAILAILDIKPPNKFESRTSKQLNFTIQE